MRIRQKEAHRRDDVLGVERDVLHAGAAVVVDILLDLALPLAGRWLVDRHLDGLLKVGHDDGAQRRELGVQLGVVDGPESVEEQRLFVPLCGRLHLVVGLVAHHVVDEVEPHNRPVMTK